MARCMVLLCLWITTTVAVYAQTAAWDPAARTILQDTGLDQVVEADTDSGKRVLLAQQENATVVPWGSVARKLQDKFGVQVSWKSPKLVAREAATSQLTSTMSSCVKEELEKTGAAAGQVECPGLTSPDLSYSMCDEESLDGIKPPVEITKRGELAMPLAGGWSGDADDHSGMSNCISDPSTCDSKLTVAMRLQAHSVAGLVFGTRLYYLSSGGVLPPAGEVLAVGVRGVSVFFDSSQLCCRVLDGEHLWEICDYHQHMGKYVHVACVLEQSYAKRSRRELKLYTAGVLRSNSNSYGIKYTDEEQAAANSARSIVLGAPNNAAKGDTSENGVFEVDDLLFFDRALEADEVKQLANNCGCLGGEAGSKPMMHWELDETSGQYVGETGQGPRYCQTETLECGLVELRARGKYTFYGGAQASTPGGVGMSFFGSASWKLPTLTRGISGDTTFSIWGNWKNSAASDGKGCAWHFGNAGGTVKYLFQKQNKMTDVRLFIKSNNFGQGLQDEGNQFLEGDCMSNDDSKVCHMAVVVDQYQASYATRKEGRSPGSNLGSISDADEADCKELCSSTQGCKAIQWRGPAATAGTPYSCFLLDRKYNDKGEFIAETGSDTFCSNKNNWYSSQKNKWKIFKNGANTLSRNNENSNQAGSLLAHGQVVSGKAERTKLDANYIGQCNQGQYWNGVLYDFRIYARQNFAEHFFRSSGTAHCTATARILIPAQCSAMF